MNFEVLPVTGLKASPLNPRKHFDPVKLQELAASFKGVGIIEPLVVRAVNGHHEIVAGERRFRAAKLAGLDTVPTVVRELTDAQVLEIMVVENNQRDDVNALEEADGFKRLLKTGYDIDRLAERIGHQRRYIFDRIKLLDLVPTAKQLLLDGRLPTSHAIVLARLEAKDQERALDPERGGVFEDDGGFDWQDEEDAVPGKAKGKGTSTPATDEYRRLKAKSVRELEQWVNDHVRFDTKAEVNEELFPETTATVDEAEKVVLITHDHYIQPDAKVGNTQRIYTSRSWKRADGTEGLDYVGGSYTRKKVTFKTCDRSVTGVVVVGPGRGEAFKVCVHKDCEVHRGAAKKTKAKQSQSREASAKAREREEAKRKAEQIKEEAQRKAWRLAIPAIRVACAEKVKTAKPGALAEIVFREFRVSAASGKTAATTVLGRQPKTADDFLRVFAQLQLEAEFGSEWYGPREFPAKAKRLGVDVAAILKKQAKTTKTDKPADGDDD